MTRSVSQHAELVSRIMAEEGLTRREAVQWMEDLPQPTEEQWLVFDALVQAAHEGRLLLMPSITNPGRVYIVAQSHDDPKLVITLAQIAEEAT